MIDPMGSVTSNPGATAGAATTGGRSSIGSIGKDEFLTLLVAQLKNQDPLNPLKPHEFAAQLAQFTSVEQLQRLNQGMEAQLLSSQTLSLLEQTNLAASLIGRSVVAEGNQVVIPESGPARVQIEVGGSGGKATLRLLDSTGLEVARRDLGALAPGEQTLTLPGDLPPGTYRYEIAVTDAKGAAIPVVTYTVGTVDSVMFKEGQILLRLGPILVPLDTVAEIDRAVAGHEPPFVTAPPSIKPPPGRV